MSGKHLRAIALAGILAALLCTGGRLAFEHFVPWPDVESVRHQSASDA
ncbi:hypothetical protein [Massilia cavernae]|nr:hypothetical protein [Massilia cavernae]